VTAKPTDPTNPSGTDTQVHAEEAYCSACNQSFPAGTLRCPNDGARLIKLAAEHDTLIGRVLDERYEIRAPLGQGGMGTVYRGWQLSVDREVAIKVIHPKLSNDRSAVKRFLREARLASRLSQPNIVNVYDFGQSGGVLYLVMELLRGHTLASELGKGRRLNAKRTVTIAAQLCDALEAAHAQGIVHRDLKPSNIVILDDPPGRDLIKVLDFGLAKSLVQDSGSLVTNTDALLGTPLYMAPEQIEGRESDQRADLYSLGCMMYEMLTGRPPFVDTAVSAVLARHMSDQPASLPAHVPPKLIAVVMRLLEKKVEDRVQSAGEVRKVLDDVREAPGFAMQTDPGSQQDISDTIPDVSDAFAETAAATPTPLPRTPAISESPVAPPKRRSWAIVALVALVPVAAIGMFVLGGSHSSAPAARPIDAAPQVVPVAVDAGVAVVDAPPAIVEPPVDAAVGKPKRSDAGVRRPPPPPPTPRDAGVKKPRPDASAEPSIDFYP
jgi:serine/threonine-protein kinase